MTNRPVYILKSQYMSLPAIEGGNYPHPPQDFITVAKMVRHLLELTVPLDILINSSMKNLPSEITSTIQGE